MVKSYTTQTIRAWGESLRAGDEILLSGTVFTARDAAHKKIVALYDRGEALPFSLTDSVIYYAGPTPARPGMPCGAFGPTTSARMDVFPTLFDLSIGAVIGKGERSQKIYERLLATKTLYFIAIGGAGALYARHITDCVEIAFPELGCESVKRITFEKFPLITAFDLKGNNIYAKK